MAFYLFIYFHFFLSTPHHLFANLAPSTFQSGLSLSAFIPNFHCTSVQTKLQELLPNAFSRELEFYLMQVDQNVNLRGVTTCSHRIWPSTKGAGGMNRLRQERPWGWGGTKLATDAGGRGWVEKRRS